MKTTIRQRMYGATDEFAATPLRVLHLTSAPRGIGGVERLLISTVGKEAVPRFSVAYCNLFDEPGDGEFRRQLRDRGAKAYHVPGLGLPDVPGMVLRLARLLRREGIHIVHAHMPHASIIGVMASRLAGVKVMVTRHYYAGEEHDRYRVGRRPWVYRLDDRAARQAHHVAAVSAAVRESLIQRGKVNASKVTIVHNGIDLSTHEGCQREAGLPWPEEWRHAFLLGCVGSFTERKAQADLVRAMPQIRAAVPGARLVLIGVGPEQAAVQALTTQLNLQDCVHFAGFQPDPAVLMRHLSVYVQPSRYEPFGIAVLEAMAASRPVVATRVGGLSEIVAHHESGLLCRAGDSAAIARAILELAADRDLAARMGARGRRRVEDHFSVDATLRRYEAIYELLAGSGPRQKAPSPVRPPAWNEMR